MDLHSGTMLAVGPAALLGQLLCCVFWAGVAAGGHEPDRFNQLLAELRARTERVFQQSSRVRVLRNLDTQRISSENVQFVS